MRPEAIFLFVAVLLAIAILLRPLGARVRLPFAAVLLLTGFIGSELFVALGRSIDIEYQGIYAVAYFGLLPLLLFGASLRLDTGTLRENLTPMALLSLPMPLVTSLMIAALMYWGINHPEGFPWQTALVAGAILTITEPFPLLASFRSLSHCRRLAVLLESEALLNIAVAITLYHIALTLMGSVETTKFDVIIAFIWSLGGGLVLGILVSLLAVQLSRRLQNPEQQALIATTTAYLGFLAGEVVFGVSGIIATLVTGFFFGRATRADFSEEQEIFQERFWGLITHIAGALIFLIMGLTFTLEMFEHQWLAIIIGILAVLFVRLPQTLMAALAFRFVPGVTPLNAMELKFGFAGGIRGAVVLALALSLPVELPGWWTVQAMAFGVVAFSLLIQSPFVRYLADRQAKQPIEEPE